MDENINSVGMVFCLRMVVLDPRITCKTFDSNKMKTASHMKVNQSYYTNQSQSACRTRRKRYSAYMYELIEFMNTSRRPQAKMQISLKM